MTVLVLRDLASFDIEFFHVVLIGLIPTSFKDMLEQGDERDGKFGWIMQRLGGF